MTERVFLVSEAQVRGLGMPPQMVSDLLDISRVPPECIEEVGANVAQAAGFLDDARLDQIVKNVIQEDAAADAVVNALRNLRPSAVPDSLSALAEWRAADPGHVEEFPDEAYASIQGALPNLIRPSPALERQRKARRLNTLTGNQARRVEIVCDARPVFDRERTLIEGFVTQTTLKFVYESQTQETQSIELVLSHELLTDLQSKAKKAAEKLRVLQESIQSWIPGGLAQAAPRDSGGTVS